jgi:hypothetical protein
MANFDHLSRRNIKAHWQSQKSACGLVHKINALLSRRSSPVLVFGLREHVLRVRQRWHPTVIEQPCIPTTMVDVKMSAHHIVHGLRRNTSLRIPFTREAS